MNMLKKKVRPDAISEIRYIESFSGAVFTIRVSVPKGFLIHALDVFVYLDGTYVESGIFEEGFT